MSANGVMPSRNDFSPLECKKLCISIRFRFDAKICFRRASSSVS